MTSGPPSRPAESACQLASPAEPELNNQALDVNNAYSIHNLQKSDE